MRKKEASPEAVNAVLEYMRESDLYTVEKFLKDNGLWINVDDSSKNTKVACPFHKDRTPSFTIFVDDGTWHCFSCGRGSSYMDLVVQYSKLVKGSIAGFYQTLNNILASDDRMKLRTGYSTIFIDVNKWDDGPFKLKRLSFDKETRKVDSYSELATRMKKEGLTDIAQIKMAILSAQDGMEPNMIYGLLTEGSVSRDIGSTAGVLSDIDMEDLLGGVTIDLNKLDGEG